MLTVGSLFAGIGGFDLGLEQTGGFSTAWFCERDEFCRRILAQHWPGVPRLSDITRVGRRRDWEPCAVDVLCGGFPCQDISPAGKRAGIGGERSGLWGEMFRLVRELRPRYVILENSSDLASRGLGRVLGDLAALRYDAEWEVLPACAFGAPHTRERMFVVAYPDSIDRGRQRGGLQRPHGGEEARHVHPWPAEPAGSRMADGIPSALDRNRVLGNALLPQIAEHIGRRILAWEGVTEVVPENDGKAA